MLRVDEMSKYLGVALFVCGLVKETDPKQIDRNETSFLQDEDDL